MTTTNYRDPFTLEEAMREIRHLRKIELKFSALKAALAAGAQPPSRDYLAESYQQGHAAGMKAAVQVQERDAEIERLDTMVTTKETRAWSLACKVDAQRKALEQALEALNNSGTIVFMDASKAHLRNEAITAIQGVLHGQD